MDIEWNRAAAAWDRHRDAIEDMKSEVTARLLAAIEPLADRQILELGAGTGELAARLAEASGPGGSLMVTDAAPAMVDLLEKRLSSYPTASVGTVDVMEMELPTAAFDVVVFRMGLMMAPDPDQALAGVRRVLRPGGTFATAVWGAPHENPWMSAVGMAAAMNGLVSGGPPVGPGGPFSLADPQDLERRVRSAGFGDVSVDVVRTHRHYRDATQQVEEISTLSPQLAEAFERFTPEQRTLVTEAVASLTQQYAAEGGGVDVPVTSLLCIAR